MVPVTLLTMMPLAVSAPVSLTVKLSLSVLPDRVPPFRSATSMLLKSISEVLRLLPSAMSDVSDATSVAVPSATAVTLSPSPEVFAPPSTAPTPLKAISWLRNAFLPVILNVSEPAVPVSVPSLSFTEDSSLTVIFLASTSPEAPVKATLSSAEFCV